MKIGPDHELYGALTAARRVQGGEVVQYEQLFYAHYVDGETDFYILIEKKPEKDSLGKPSKIHRGYYPPEVE